MSEPLQRLKFFCLTHQESCTTQRATPLPMCDQGPHSLTENFLRDKWEYCCACESFFARDDHQPAKSKCPSCERTILARYLCDTCDTLSFETDFPPPLRGFAFSATGLPYPACPCCLARLQAPTVEHQCTTGLRAPYRTPRQRCPFCGEPTAKAALPAEVAPTRPLTEELPAALPASDARAAVFPGAFEKPLSEYLNMLNGKAIKAKTVFTHPNALIESDDGQFWLTKYRDDDSFIVFPGVPQLSSAADFAPFQTAFDCGSPAAGQLVISAPAVAYLNPTSRIWTITQKGNLKVLTQPPPPPVSQPEPQSARTSPVTAPIPASPAGNKTLIFVGAGVLAVALIGVLIYVFFGSAKSQIISKVKQGQIVTPAGSSAYDLFMTSNLSDGDRAEVGKEIAPLLEAKGNEIIRQLVSDGYTPSASDSDGTAKIFDWLDRLSPQNLYKARKHYFLGRAAFDRKDFSSAENDIRRATGLDPNWALAANHMGRVYFQRKDYTTTQGWYQRAIDLDPNWMVPRINLCVLAVENLKNSYLGEQACRNVLQIDQNKASGYYFLGRALEGQQRKCDALRAYRLAVEKASGASTPGFNVDKLSQALPKLASQCGG